MTSFEPTGISTVDELRTNWARRRNWLYGTTTAALAVIVGLAVVELVTGVDVYGVGSATVRASGGGYDLSVERGIESLDEVKLAVLEPTGRISFILYRDES